MMTAPERVSVSMFLICTRFKGVSLTRRTSFFLSFIQTSAPLSMRLPDTPDAILPIVPIEQGATTMPSGEFDPDAKGAEKFFSPNTRSFSPVKRASIFLMKVDEETPSNPSTSLPIISIPVSVAHTETVCPRERDILTQAIP